MIKLSQEAIYTTYSFTDESYKVMADVIAIIRDLTSARPRGFRFMPSYKSGAWDGYIHLTHGNEFPTGLCWDVEAALADKGYQIHTEIRYPSIDRDMDKLAPNMFSGITLRDYQIDAAQQLLAYDRGVAKMATNSGKTAVISAISRVVAGSVLILCTNKELLYQTVDKLGERLGEKIGIIGDGHLVQERVTVGMIQTLVKRLDDRLVKHWLDRLACVVFDECHHAPAKTSQDVMFSIPAPLRFGFSGTPLSHDKLTDLVLIGATGPVCVDVTNAQLIDRGISARPIVYMYTIEGIIDVNRMIDNSDASDYAVIYREFIVANEIRNTLLVQKVIQSKANSVLILVDRIEHGLTLADAISGSVFVSGKDSMADRLDALESLRKGTGSIVIATSIFDEGVDVPAVDLLVLAGGGKGYKRLLQRLGRGMRRKEGHNVLMVIDFMDMGDIYLRRHSKTRKAVYEAEGFEVIVE